VHAGHVLSPNNLVEPLITMRVQNYATEGSRIKNDGCKKMLLKLARDLFASFV